MARENCKWTYGSCNDRGADRCGYGGQVGNYRGGIRGDSWRRGRNPGGPIPDRWLAYKSAEAYLYFPQNLEHEKPNGEKHPAGQKLSGFLPCKTFLDEVFNIKIGDENKFWSPLNLIRFSKQIAEENNMRSSVSPIVAVVNLCQTERYYQPLQLIQNNIDYYWMSTKGRGEIPTDEEIIGFIKLIDRIREEYNDEGIIAVHCTHGVNRTGFFICFYLMCVFNFSFEDAHIYFIKTRGHSIERAELIDHLSKIDLSKYRNMLLDKNISYTTSVSCLKAQNNNAFIPPPPE